MVRTNYPRAFMVLAAVVLATILLLLIVATKPAEAAFPGRNGKIVFESNRTTGAGVDNPTGDQEIFTMSKDGTGLKQLTFNTADDRGPSWSTDSTKIAFMTERDAPGSGNFEIYTMNADGSAQTRRTTNSIGDGSPAYSPDGKQIVFVSSRDGNSEIYRMRVDGSLQTLFSNNPASETSLNWQPLR